MPGLVFVSYSRNDQAYVDRLIPFLRESGLAPWVDHNLEVGDRWTNVIREQVDTCSAFVVVMSPQAEESPWVGREIHRAEAMRKPILPLLIKGQVFFRLGDLQFEDVADGRMPGPVFMDRLRRYAANLPGAIAGSGEDSHRIPDRARSAEPPARRESRGDVDDFLIPFGGRMQALLRRQLTIINDLERDETRPDNLEVLFRVEHLTLRMRRTIENLLIPDGDSPKRTSSSSLRLLDVIRNALSEVEDYIRVAVKPFDEIFVNADAVGDVTHLFAELIENALSFSSPHTEVRIGGSIVDRGFAVEIEDRGLGMEPGDVAAANRLLQDPPASRPVNTVQLGLYVVARLAQRQGIRARLTESIYGGVTAVVVLPGPVLAAPEDKSSPERTAPRHRAGDRSQH